MKHLSARYVDGAGSFVTLLNVKGDLVTFFKFIKRNTLELLGVKEQILRLAFARDEPVSSIRFGLDGSYHIFYLYIFLQKSDPLFFSLIRLLYYARYYVFYEEGQLWHLRAVFRDLGTVIGTKSTIAGRLGRYPNGIDIVAKEKAA